MNASRRARPRWEWAFVILLLLAAFGFRVYRLSQVPPGLHHDDIKNVLLVEKILDGYVRAYYPENYGHEPLYHWLQALYFALVGSGYPELRLLSVAISMSGLALIYVLAKRLLGRNTALWTLAWQATSLWPLFYSRRAIRGVLLVPLAALTGYAFIAGIDDERAPFRSRWVPWIVGGISLAACLYTYMGSRVLPLFFILYVLYLALVERRRVAAHWRGVVLFALVALLLSLPLIAYLISHREERMSQINMPLNAVRNGEWRPLLENSLRALGMFTTYGDPHWRQFVADMPVFGPLGAVLFVAGLGICLWRWRTYAYVFWPLWLLVALLPGMLSEGAPNYLRPIAVQVAVYVFPALATVKLLWWLSRRGPRALTWAAAGGLVLVLVLNAWRTYDGYFQRWPAHPDVRFAYNSTLLDVGQYLNASADVDSAVLSGHFPADLDPAMVDAVSRRADLAPRWVDIRQSLVYPGGESTHLVQPDYFTVDPALQELFLGSGAPIHEHRLADGTFVFAVYPLGVEPLLGRLALAEQGSVGWSGAGSFPEGLPEDWQALDYPIRFGDRVDLLGYEVLNGEQVAPGDVVTALTYWRAVQPGSSQGITFLHLLGPEGAVVSGYDGFGAPPNHWMDGDVIVQVHRLALPGTLPPGAYLIELGWYQRDTGARWPIPLPDGGQIDRLLLQPLMVQ
jgi:4-amino-4-deoxy-L-arabinose transferase-like glycosyltransferase